MIHAIMAILWLIFISALTNSLFLWIIVGKMDELKQKVEQESETGE